MPYDGTSFPHRQTEIAILNQMQQLMRTRARWCQGSVHVHSTSINGSWDAYCLVGALNVADHEYPARWSTLRFRFQTVAAHNVKKRLDKIARSRLSFWGRRPRVFATYAISYNDSHAYEDVMQLLTDAQQSFEAERQPLVLA